MVRIHFPPAASLFAKIRPRAPKGTRYFIHISRCRGGGPPGRPEATGDIGGLPSRIEGVGIADIEVAAACRDLWVMLWRKAQMQLDLAPAHKPIFGICFAGWPVGSHVKTQLSVMSECRRHVPHWQDRCCPLHRDFHCHLPLLLPSCRSCSRAGIGNIAPNSDLRDRPSRSHFAPSTTVTGPGWGANASPTTPYASSRRGCFWPKLLSQPDLADRDSWPRQPGQLGTAARGRMHDPRHPLTVEFRRLLLETARVHLCPRTRRLI